MTDQSNIENLFLSHFRMLREDVASVKNQLVDLDKKVEDGFLNLNVRMTSIEQKLDGIGTAQTAQSDRLDNLEKRVQRLERHAHLIDDPV